MDQPFDQIIEPKAIKQVARQLEQSGTMAPLPQTPPRLLLRLGHTEKQDILDQSKPVEIQK
jgi:hypothetical protein